jgi:voltage-gated potassium channel Kch
MTAFDSDAFRNMLEKQIRSWWFRLAMTGIFCVLLITVIIVFRTSVAQVASRVLVILLSASFLLFSDIIIRSDIRTYRRMRAWSMKLEGIPEQHITCTVVSVKDQAITLDGVRFVEFTCSSDVGDMTLYMPELSDPVGFETGQSLSLRVKNRRIVGLAS